MYSKSVEHVFIGISIIIQISQYYILQRLYEIGGRD